MAAAACGAQHEVLHSHAKEQQDLAAWQRQAAAAGRTAVLVQPRSDAEAASTHLPCISEQQLLLAIVNNTAEPLQQAVQLFAAEHPMQHQQPQQPDAEAAAHSEDDGDKTEADETEVEEEAEPSGFAPVAAVGSAGAAAAPSPALTPAAAAAAVRTRHTQPLEPYGSSAGWHQHAPSECNNLLKKPGG